MNPMTQGGRRHQSVVALRVGAIRAREPYAMASVPGDAHEPMERGYSPRSLP